MNGSPVGNEPHLREWRGSGRDTGRLLSAEDHAAAYAEYQRGQAFRERIDDAVAAAFGRFDSRHGGEQAGIEHSFKSWESYRTNVAAERAVTGSIKDAVQQKDLHRYTFTFPADERYETGVEDAYRSLEGSGFAPVRGQHKNWWGNDSYQGINTVWEHRETGRRVETQFHTRESFAAKQRSHTAYQVQRSPFLADGETPMRPDHVSATRQMQADEYKSTTVPPNESIRPDLMERVRLPARGAAGAEARAQMEDEVARERERHQHQPAQSL